MIARLRKIRAKVGFFGELSEKCVKKSANWITSRKVVSPVPPNTFLVKAQAPRQSCCCA